jgi:ribonuclease HI
MEPKLFKQGKLLISTDGGSRGNPGPAAIGFVVGTKKYSEAIGHTTNNIAEYRAVVAALKKAKQLLGKKTAKLTDVEVSIDSELIYKQVRGEYKILEPDLQTLFVETWNLLQDFKSVTLKKVPRERNKEADALVNEALDGKARHNKTELTRLL